MVVESDTQPLIELENLTLRYGASEIVSNASLVFPQGRTSLILGPSGVGKSTILKAILGLIEPAAGSIRIQGLRLGGLSEKKMLPFRRRMAMVFQHGALFDTMTVGENVSFRLRELRLDTPAGIEEKVREVLSFVGLEGAAKLKPSQLSGGMRKRAAVARALAADPEIFLFDEPTVGLDPVNLHNIEQLILKLKTRPKTPTQIIVTHDVASACRLGDFVVMLHGGRFIFQGTPAQLLACPDERVRLFLDPGRTGQTQPNPRKRSWPWQH